MDQEQLQELVKKISKKFFGKPFIHQVKINRRMRTTGGRYHLDDHHLEINVHFLEPKYAKYLEGIIKHELCHYHLHLAGKGYRHRDRDFKNLLKKVNGSRYAPDIGLRKTKKANYLYICQNCQQRYFRMRKIDTRKFCCGRCRGKLILQKKFK